MSNAKTILIVDDSESDRLLCRRHLKDDPQIKYLILEASTAQAGLELWQSQNPDVVIVDLNLPGDSGLDLLEAIRENLEADSDRAMSDLKLPIIILTGSEDVRDAVVSMRLGGASH
ncbi:MULTISPECIES: response regulator [Pseudanabaena]|uniref:Response regulator receiver protein n=2 Tax=Pseudanabaena TaxID=1152 RepID=L8MZQ4_9CYAN|nr:MULTISPECIES: response regulator [Pseudanabaena]ELS33457.1 response regulator receiver protein [Pseudanabaena biceps PCC 7429]MDG3494308.1 response regulator [Pseudanabaena catenata USMAC16]